MKNRKNQLDAMMLKMEPMKPSLHLSSKDLKEVKDWEVGEEYKVELTIKQKSKREHDGMMMGDFEVVSVKSKQ